MPTLLTLGILVALIGIVIIVYAKSSGLGSGAHTLSKAEHAELDARRDLDDRLKELAWEHRDIAPELAVILLDEIRTFEKAQRDQNPRGKELGS